MKSYNLLSLNEVDIGDSCYIKKITGLSNEFIKRMYDLGFVFNSSITPIYKSMFGSTVAYLIKGSMIALREKDAKNIMVSFRR